ncbi:D-alanine--poly(phosphoribitol) ligase subunit 2 [Clostridium botulinum]|uniref:D-alanyl carrier protein n=1 Tax=Clostridium botulinum TaxID=1491 RepID=A0ABC8CZM5_CLOBO|nr:D-alanine--poly(phosphoribitol) ligase subunit DltC [Clostridium botulinum]AVQ40593.1 D-alanine--poly(phosphoribitol) ligase subunit 2 [Clostridium botulinum]MDU1323512.1 D-alanine--poly(phosphoribitol) ligase subunit DltC [Clostridium botulinum]
MEDKILEILIEVCGTDEVKDDMDLNLFDNELLDSLGLIELILAIEEQVGIKIEPTEITREEFDSPNKIIKCVSKRL